MHYWLTIYIKHLYSCLFFLIFWSCLIDSSCLLKNVTMIVFTNILIWMGQAILLFLIFLGFRWLEFLLWWIDWICLLSFCVILFIRICWKRLAVQPSPHGSLIQLIFDSTRSNNTYYPLMRTAWWQIPIIFAASYSFFRACHCSLLLCWTAFIIIVHTANSKTKIINHRKYGIMSR